MSNPDRSAPRDAETRIADIEIALRQIMDETGVSRMKDGNPLYNGAYRSGLAGFVRKVIDERERTGWIAVAHNVVILGYLVVFFTFVAVVVTHVR